MNETIRTISTATPTPRVETDASGATLNEYVYFGGKRVAVLPAGGNAQFYVEDLLGSSRVITTNNGTVCYDADLDPAACPERSRRGGEHPYTNNCPSSNSYKFEGKERDTETGNDDFGARYYTERFGRWLSADWSSVPVAVPYANLTNPQTLNLYAMVSDDPESFADLEGHGVGCPENPRAGKPCNAKEPDSQTQKPNCDNSSPTCQAQMNVVTTWNSYSNPITETLTVTKTDTTTISNADGSVTTVVEKTTVTFSTSQDQPGIVLNATEQGSVTRSTSDGRTSSFSTRSPLGDRISASEAGRRFGRKAFSDAQAAAVPGNAELFVRAVNNDRRGAIHAAIGVVSLFTPVPEGFELGHALFDVGMAAYDLISGSREAGHPQ